MQGEIINFDSQEQFDILERRVQHKVENNINIEELENINIKGFNNKKYYKFYCNKCKDHWVLRDASFPDNGFFIRTRERVKYDI